MYDKAKINKVTLLSWGNDFHVVNDRYPAGFCFIHAKFLCICLTTIPPSLPEFSDRNIFANVFFDCKLKILVLNDPGRWFLMDWYYGDGNYSVWRKFMHDWMLFRTNIDYFYFFADVDIIEGGYDTFYFLSYFPVHSRTKWTLPPELRDGMVLDVGAWLP